MTYRILADAVLVTHLGFILFVVAGGLLVPWRPAVVWLHLPAVGWGALIEFQGWLCPLTPLEVWARERAGDAAYRGGFIEHYLLPLIYPAGLTREVQIALGALVLIVNALVYGWLIGRRLKRKGSRLQ